MAEWLRGTRVGFGREPFGEFRFGFDDWAEVVLWKSIPEEYRKRDLKVTGPVANPLRKLFYAIQPLFQDIRERVELFPQLRDPEDIPIELIDFFAKDFDFVTDPTRADEFRRAEILNIAQLLRRKGTDRGYGLVGAIDSFLVTVEGLWEDPCDSGILTTQGPTIFAPRFDDFRVDDYPVDMFYNDEYALGLFPLDPATGICRTHSLRMTIIQDLVGFDFVDRISRLLGRLARFTPIHVTFEEITVRVPEGELQVVIDLEEEGIVVKFEGDVPVYHHYDNIEDDEGPLDMGLRVAPG